MPFPDPGTLAVFAAAAIALLVIPGPAVLYIVTQSIEHGRTAGLVSMLGIQTGGLVHVLAERMSRAESPSAAASTCTSPPAEIPSAETTPATRPRSIAWATM